MADLLTNSGAVFSADRARRITLKGEAWSIEFPDADYPGWLAFYERMTERDVA